MKLQKLQFIQEFTVDYAEYQFFDWLGACVRVRVNYANNTFSLHDISSTDQSFLKEVEALARGLLARKHAVNLAEKEHLLVK